MIRIFFQWIAGMRRRATVACRMAAAGLLAAWSLTGCSKTEIPSVSETRKPSAVRPDTALDDATRAMIGRCVDVIRRCQMPDGMIRMRSETEHVWTVPYFANIAAMGLLAAHTIQSSPEDLQRVERWLNWYANHQEPDGIIYDQEGTVEKYSVNFKFDASDSYASTYLQTLWRYWQVKRDSAMRDRCLPAATRALTAIQAVTDRRDGLTFAKPEYPIKFLMDNLEVCMGLEEGALFFDALHAPQQARQARYMLSVCKDGLRQFWSPEKGFFAWGMDAFGFATFGFKEPYPDGLINLFAASHLTSPPAGLWEKLKETFLNHPQIAMERWLEGAVRLSDAGEQPRLKQKLLATAEKMKPGGVNVDVAGYTILALAGEKALWPRVTVAYQQPWVRADPVKAVFNDQGDCALPIGIGPLKSNHKATARIERDGRLFECVFNIEAKGCYVQIQFPWDHAIDLGDAKKIRCVFKADSIPTGVVCTLGLADHDGDIWDFQLAAANGSPVFSIASAVKNPWPHPGANGKPDWTRMVGYRLQISSLEGPAKGKVTFGEIVAAQ
ncbi:MAG: hypothetical protein HY360_18015 [Verrucomicrobia bacterium]|nr:hypothetical protein [Verrucomicrobiota bacterium]